MLALYVALSLRFCPERFVATPINGAFENGVTITTERQWLWWKHAGGSTFVLQCR